MNKNCEELQYLIVSQRNPLKVVVLTVTCLADKAVYNSSFFHILNFSSIRQIRKP